MEGTRDEKPSKKSDPETPTPTPALLTDKDHDSPPSRLATESLPAASLQKNNDGDIVIASEATQSQANHEDNVYSLKPTRTSRKHPHKMLLNSETGTHHHEENNLMTKEDGKATVEKNHIVSPALKRRTNRKSAQHKPSSLPPSTPGALAVENTIVAAATIAPVNDIEDEVNIENPNQQESDRNASFIVSARLVIDDDDDHHGNDPESLRENFDSTILRVVAEPIKLTPDGTVENQRKICGMIVANKTRTTVVVIMIVFLVLVGIIVTWPMVVGSIHVKPSTYVTEPRRALIQVLEPWITSAGHDTLPFQDQSSLQFHALDWLLFDNLTIAAGSPSRTVLERYVMTVLYFATDGPDWTGQYANVNFLTNESICNWNDHLPYEDDARLGIYCQDTPHVRSIWLSSVHLAGTIPWELSLLFDLQELNFYGDALTGSIPKELGNMTSLDLLILSRNNLVGTIPTELGQMSSLGTLYVDGNQLTGTVPTEMGLMTALDVLDVAGNRLNGTLPTEFGRLTALSTVHVENNMFTGSVPMELSQWNFTLMHEFVLSGNDFFGMVDDYLCPMNHQWNTFQSDCLPSTTSGGNEIQCGCCTSCCNAYGQNCQQMPV